MWAGGPENAVILLNWPESGKVVSVTSSNKSVVKVGKKKGVGPNDMYMRGVKPGKATVTVKYRIDGKLGTASQVITVKAYPNPFAWVKVNGKKVNLSKNKYALRNKKYDKETFTISFKLNAGWKLETSPLPGAYWIGDAYVDSFNWKNGKSFTLPAEYDRLCAAIDISNKNTCDFFNYEIWFLK